MCERYALPEQLAAEREFVPAQAWWKYSPRFNVAAQQYVPAIRLHEGQSEGVMMHWGLIPSWAEGKRTGDTPTCVEADLLERSTLHREPWFQGRRCIMPAAGFYAWRLTSARYRQPYFVRLIDRAVFGFAAIWDRSEGEDDDVIESCSLISVGGNDLLRGICNGARLMPAILRRRDYDTWLHGKAVQAKAVLQPYWPEGMQAYPVSPRVNSVAIDDAGLIRPTPLRPTQGSFCDQ